jgi:hypothetical protein
MNDLAIQGMAGLPELVRKAAAHLASAETAAEVLEARDMASVAYDAAKKAARMLKAQAAFEEVIVAAAHAQADAIEIECAAKRRIADEYDTAQERGEVQRHGGQGKRDIPDQNIPSIADFPGLTSKDIHNARIIRDAEEADPGIIRRILDERIANGEEPSRASVNRAIAPQREPLVNPASLFLWGRLRDFQRMYREDDIPYLLDKMTGPMRADVREALPCVREFLEQLEVALNDYP